MEKRGQITIFIIIAILLVATGLLLFFWGDLKGILISISPEEYLQSCMKEYGGEALQIVEARGGSINPENYILYENEKVEYLCYINENYKTCVMQQPLLKEHIEEQIASYLQPRMEQCMQSFKEEYEARGYSINYNNVNMKAELTPDKLTMRINNSLSISQEGVSDFDNFETFIPTNLYDFSMITLSILNWEARYGNLETTSYMNYYPDFKLEKIRKDDGSKIYVLSNRETEESFTFATRSLAWPAGLGYGELNMPNQGG